MPRERPSSRITDRTRGRILVVAVFVVVWGLITHGTYAGSGDSPHYVMIAHSIAFDADLDLANDYREAILIGGGTLAPGPHAVERDGRLRPVHDIGLPLAIAPIVRLAYPAAQWLGEAISPSVLKAARLNASLIHRHAMSLVMALLTGLLAREVFLAIRSSSGGGWSAFAWALLFALSPPILSHSYLVFTEIPSALVMMFVFRKLAAERNDSAVVTLVLGGLAGFLVLVHARNIGIVFGLTLIVFLMAARRRVSTTFVVAFVAALGALVLVRALSTYVMWGSLLTTPHATTGAVTGGVETARELFARGSGLLLDREHGLLAYGPIYLLAAPGLWLFWRRGDPDSRHALLLLACYLVPVLLPLTNVHGWRGGWSPAARFLVPVAPLLWLGVVAYASHAAGIGRWIVNGLVAVQLVVNAYLWQVPRTLWNDGDGVSAAPWGQWLPSWSDAGAVPSFALALVVMLALSSVCAWFVTRDSIPSPAERTT